MNSFVIMAITDIIIDQTIRYAIGFLTEQPEPHLGDIGGFMSGDPARLKAALHQLELFSLVKPLAFLSQWGSPSS